MQKIINNIRLNDLVEPLKNLAAVRETQLRTTIDAVDPEEGKTTITTQQLVSHSLYRDILFLVCKALGRAQIDLNVFDQQYTMAYGREMERNSRLYSNQDKPISLNSLYCRQYFRPLSLP